MTGSDGELLARLAAAADEDSPPPLLVETAKALFGLRALDAEVAELTSDSLESAGAVRGSTSVRLLGFETEDVVVDVEVSTVGERLRLVGQVAADASYVAIDSPTSTATTEVDALGRFVADDVPRGPVRLRFNTGSGAVATSWTYL